MTDRTPGAPATPVAAAPGVTNPTRKSPRGILQNRERSHASQLGRPAVRRPGPRTPQNLTSRGHLKEGVCPSDLTAAVVTDLKPNRGVSEKPWHARSRRHGSLRRTTTKRRAPLRLRHHPCRRRANWRQSAERPLFQWGVWNLCWQARSQAQQRPQRGRRARAHVCHDAARCAVRP